MPSVSEVLFPVARYDRTSKIVTALTCAVLLAVALIPSVPPVVWGFSIAIVLLSYAYSPRAYVVSERCVAVKRLVGSVLISLDGVREARVASDDDLRGCIRLWGNGGVFGYYGVFRTSKLGKCRWYVTDRSKAVVVVTDAKTVLFSPADAQSFLAAVGAPASAPGGLPFSTGGSAATKLGVAVAVITLGVIAFALLYSPGPPTYTLTPDALTIHDRFYSVSLNARDVDAAQIRIVDLGEEPDWRAVSKTNGFANAHYQSGWFRLANGKTVRLYRSGGSRLVLLPSRDSGPTVLYQAQDPDQFADQVRQEWRGR